MKNTSALARLIDIARSLGRIMELHSLLDEILSKSLEVTEAEGCSIFLPDHATGELVLNSAQSQNGAVPQLCSLRVPKGAGVAGEVFASKKSLNIHDAAKDPRHYSKISEKVGITVRNIITVPLLHNNECLGVFQAVNAIGRDHFDDDDETVCEAFAGLIVSAMLRIEAQKREVEAVKTRQELELAREIQQTFLPPEFAVFPTCRIRMTYTSAKHVGGDFCFVHPTSDGKLLLGLGDVSGKGVPAAMNMARATATIKALVPQLHGNLGEWVTQLNKQLSADLRGGRFIGITFMLADENQKSVQVCSAGQFAPLSSDGTKWSQADCVYQLPLGILPNFQYISNTFPLERGHLWLLFSDGITEARNEAGEELTLEGFVNSLKTCRCPSEVFHSAEESWKKFAGHAPQHDDASLLLLDWRGKKPQQELKLTCQPSTLCEGRKFVEEWALYCGFDDITAGQIVLAFDEAVTNIFRHAYKSDPGPVSFHIESTPDYKLVITLEDEGLTVDPALIKGRDLDDIRPGGLGTVLLKSVFDDIDYQPLSPKGTRLVLMKKIPTSECCEGAIKMLSELQEVG